MINPFSVDISLPLIEEQASWWFVFRHEEILLIDTPLGLQIPQFADSREFGFSFNQVCRFGYYQDIACMAAHVSEAELDLPPHMIFQPLRESYMTLANQELFLVVIKALQVLLWDKRTQFCGCCGAKMILSKQEPAKQCPRCASLFYPQISPVMLALIWRNDEILLARSAHFPRVYSILAGFVEPGETLEQCVMREVKEEVNLQVKNLTYFASQPWPFPSNLMLGFLAEYEQGEIQINPTELEDARWFSVNNLPPLPSSMSLSRRMIDAYVTKKS